MVGIKGAVVSILGGLFADGQNLKVMFSGGFRDPFSAVKLADHGIRRAFDDSGLIAVELDHVFHGLARFDHSQIVFFLADEPFGFLNIPLYFFPDTRIFGSSHTRPLRCFYFRGRRFLPYGFRYARRLPSLNTISLWNRPKEVKSQHEKRDTKTIFPRFWQISA